MTTAMASLTRLRDCGLPAPVVVPPGATILQGARRLREANVSSLLVGEPARLVAIVTERDIVTAVARGLVPGAPITAISADNPYTIPAEATLADAGHRMVALGVRHLVVADGDRALGVVAMRDVAAVLLSGADHGDVALASVRSSITDHPEFWLG